MYSFYEYFENADFREDYLYHYTDAESALSILCDGVIYPYKMKTNPEQFETKAYIFLSKRNPTFPDIILTESIYQYSKIRDNNFNSSFHKLEYAFGFNKKTFKNTSKLEEHSKLFWKHPGEIKLKDNELILVKRYFTFG